MRLCAIDRELNLSRETTELLSQSQWRGVHQMRSTNLEDRVKRLGFVQQPAMQSFKRRQQLPSDLHAHRHMNRRGKCVVGALTHIYMVIRMDRFFGIKSISAGQFNCPIRNDFIGIHITGGAASGLIHINRKLIIKFPVGNLSARR